MEESNQSDRLEVSRQATKQEASADEPSSFHAFWEQFREIDSPPIASAVMVRGGF